MVVTMCQEDKTQGTMSFQIVVWVLFARVSLAKANPMTISRIRVVEERHWTTWAYFRQAD